MNAMITSNPLQSNHELINQVINRNKKNPYPLPATGNHTQTQ